MSYDIRLKDPGGGTHEFPESHRIHGGTYAMGGTREAWLNVTYNYGGHFSRVLDGGIRSIYGMTAKDSIPVLEKAIAKLGDDISDDYWEATEGNARMALMGLQALAVASPGNCVWDGD